MLRRHLWKLILSATLVLWAVFTLMPLKDQPFGDYVKASAAAKPAEFAKLMGEVSTRVQSRRAPSVYVALKQLGQEQNLDLSQFFPQIKLESSMTNIEKRNNLLLDELLRLSKGKLQLGLDLKGGVAFTLEADPKVMNAESEQSRGQKLSKAVEIIGGRINSLGVTEPIIRPIGDNRIEIQLPGVSTKDNPEMATTLVRPARLDFRMVHATIAPPAEAPPGYDRLTLVQESRPGMPGYTEELYVKTRPEMTGEGIADSYPTMDEFGRFRIILKFTSAGSKQFADVTRAIAEEGQRTGRRARLAIVLDGKLYSAPGVEKEISGGSAEISGSFTRLEAQDLSTVLNNPLDLPLQIKEQYEVGPSLATDAISSGVRATIIGTAAVAAFMITFYATGGLVAVASLVVNITIILGVMASIGATMTLPGLAGIVLTIGMAVDANILIFERMREEIALGKNLVSANQGGFTKALTTILDAHLVQLIICGIMIWKGQGPIKGFGFTLLIGVISTLISVLITGHMLMEMLTESGWLKKMTMRRMLGDLNVDFVKLGKPCAYASVALVIISFGYVLFQGDKIYGIDFAGGDQVTATFTTKIDSAKIREIAQSSGAGEVNPTYVSDLGSGKEQLKLETAYGKSGTLFTALQQAYPGAGLVKVGTSQIGATIGKEIKWNAVLAVGLSMLAILVYIAFRFEFGFGVGAMAATLHDILMNIGIFVMFGHQFSAPMVAAILCVAGYSINETVVVFDRIREELKLDPAGKLRDVINNAIRKVFARTIMTATTTFLAALALFIFGGGQLHDIAFTFLVGIVTSTFSAIFIAAQIFYLWHKGDRKHVEAHQDIAPKYEWAGSSRASE
ncbi:protein translocase subunit SecD [Opitutus sp. GAS368]|jgi:SecD/SecF fusion protein|uniref:protein translocase subunit SecD n=1 Tax=Opitutus sp. GAS368 TaxID=1882749 RepID=UPI00087A0F03|nr:protein translocase subunit SecD [Opitutus sp. GAS368]SDS50865.1 SecD/SecF fusion protein [Opitutus sp. GAS368]